LRVWLTQETILIPPENIINKDFEESPKYKNENKNNKQVKTKVYPLMNSNLMEFLGIRNRSIFMDSFRHRLEHYLLLDKNKPFVTVEEVDIESIKDLILNE